MGREGMIVGVGSDLVSIARIERVWGRHGSRFTGRILAVAEEAVLGEMKHPALQSAYLAKRFAAKEAFFKALGKPSCTANTWKQLAILNAENRRPYIVLGQALEVLTREMGIIHCHVTLSDEREYAMATVILESGG